MSPGRRLRRDRLVALALAVVSGAPTLAYADVAPAGATAPTTANKAAPSADRIRSAEAEFSAGRRAYNAKDYEQAALHFENAFNDAPAAEPLKNAIRSRRLGRQLARAATLAALAMREYPNDASTTTLATEVLKEASPKFHEVTLKCAPECSVAADGRLVSLATADEVRFFLPPGKHQLVVSWSEDRTRMSDIDAKAGGKDALSLEAPPMPPPKEVATVSAPTVATTLQLAPEKPKPLPPIVFFVGAGLTAAGVAATIVSGIDATNNPGTDAVRAQCKGLGESCPAYQDGLSAQLRTNVILGVTGGLVVGTAVVGLFFTQWSRPASVAATASRRSKNADSGTWVSPWASHVPGGAAAGFVGTF